MVTVANELGLIIGGGQAELALARRTATAAGSTIV